MHFVPVDLPLLASDDSQDTQLGRQTGAAWVVDVSDWNPDGGYTQTMRWLDAHPELTAILAGNDGVAFGA